MDLWTQLQDALQRFLQTEWARDAGLLLAAVAITYFPSRWVVSRFERIRENAVEMPREERIFRVLTEVSFWPILAMGVLVGGLRILAMVQDDDVAPTTQLLPLLVFFLGYRVLIRLVFEFMPSGERRRRLRRVAIPSIFLLAALQQLGILTPLLQILQRPILELAGVSVSLFSILSAVFVVFAFTLGGRLMASFLGRRFLPGVGFDPALSEAVGTVVRYVMVVFGLMVGLTWLGFDLTTVQIAFGALGVGIGFGLQNIVNNFMSGLILLFERSVKRGDILTAAGTDGRVTNIGLRASVLRTRSGDDIIVPNSLLVSERVTNYNFGDRLKRIELNVGVSYQSDPNHVREILLAVGKQHADVLAYPEPNVLFKEFGDSSLNFELRVWIDNAWRVPEIGSDLRFAVWDALKEASVEIPFPQRDLHLKSGFIPEARIDTPR